MDYYTGDNKDILANRIELWLTEKGYKIDRHNFTFICMAEGLEIKGVVVYTDYTEYSVSMDIFAPKCLNRTVIRSMFNYPFNQLEVKKLYGNIESKNEHSQRIFNRLGCRHIAALDDFYGEGNHRLIYVAEKDDVKQWVS